MIGSMVYTTWPVPHSIVRKQVVKGARIDTYLGLRRSTFSAACSITSSPPEACSVAEAATTAMMVSITSTGGLPGGRPNANTSTTMPMPPSSPSAIPPLRAP